jgi:MFS family permease
MYYPLQKTRGNLLQSLITIASSSGFLLYGYDQGVFSGVIVTPYFLTVFNNPDANLLGVVNSIFDIGGALGAGFCFCFGNILGRRRTIMLGCTVVIVGSILQGTSKAIAQLLVASMFRECTVCYNREFTA